MTFFGPLLERGKEVIYEILDHYCDFNRRFLWLQFSLIHGFCGL